MVALRSWERSLPHKLIELAAEPSAHFPRLLSREGVLPLLAFPAAAGIFAVYSAAKALALGDRFPFAAVLAAVVVMGVVAGLAALWFVGSLPDWSRERVWRRGAERAWLSIVFVYATWPFAPLLVLVAGTDLMLLGSSAFSAARAPLPTDVAWALRALIGMGILLWVVLMVTGTAIVRYEDRLRAAREVSGWMGSLAGAAVLFAVMVGLVLRVW